MADQSNAGTHEVRPLARLTLTSGRSIEQSQRGPSVGCCLSDTSNEPGIGYEKLTSTGSEPAAHELIGRPSDQPWYFAASS